MQSRIENWTMQFRSFGFWSFDIALRLPVIRIGLYNRPLRVVSLSNHFGFRNSDFEFLLKFDNNSYSLKLD
jgi:hypothetical protein